MTDPRPLIRVEEVTKAWPAPEGVVRALDRVSLTVTEGEFLAVTGPSGSGKSTLLSLLACIELPTAGEIRIGGRPVKGFSDDGLAAFRRDHIGFVPGQFGLFPHLTVGENLELPLLLKNVAGGVGERCTAVLAAVGLGPDLLSRRPDELPREQQRRVAIARALVNDPEIIVCDEPAVDLDSKAGEGILALLSDLNRKGKTILIATRDPPVAARAGRTIRLADGRVA